MIATLDNPTNYFKNHIPRRIFNQNINNPQAQDFR